MIALGP